MKIGILGVRGRLGSYILFKYDGDIHFIDIDITNIQEVKNAGLNNYDVIINCAAKTGVDLCEHGQVKSFYFSKAVEVNCRALEYIRSNFLGRLIHISTDYVFDGKSGPYKETAKRNPVNDYGYTKWGGEIILETHPNNCETVIVRTTGLFGIGKDYAAFVLECLRNKSMLVASNELKGNHTYIPHLAEALMYISTMPLKTRLSVFHVASSDVMSRYDFSIMIANVFGYSPEFIYSGKNRDIQGWIAPRPTKGGLKVNKALQRGIPIYTTLEGLKSYENKITVR